MATGETKATIKIGEQGADQTAKKLRDVDGAKKKLGGTTKDQVAATTQATEAQEKQNASTESYAALLTQVHPALGMVAQATIHATRIAGDLASKEINLRSTFRKATAAAKANIKTLKLLGATSLVVAGIALVVKVVKELREAIKKATEAMALENKTTQESTKLFRDNAAAIREAADARERMQRMSIEQSEAIQKQVERDQERFAGAVPADESAWVRAAYAGSGLTEDQIMHLVMARAGGADIMVNSRASPPARRAIGEAHLRRRGVQDAIRAGFAAADLLRRRQAQDLLSQAQQGEGEDIEALIRRETVGLSEEDLENYLEIIKHLGGTTGGLKDGLREGRARYERSNAPRDVVLAQSQLGQSEQGFFSGTRAFHLDPRQLSEVTRVLTRIEETVRQSRGPSIGLQYNFGADANAAARRARSPESVAALIE